MNWEEDILIAEDLDEFEHLIHLDQKPNEIELVEVAEIVGNWNKDYHKEIDAKGRKFNLVYLIILGEHDVHIGAEHFRIRPNDLVIIPENLVYSINYRSNCKGFFVCFKSEFILPLLKDHIADHFPFLDIEAEHILHLEKEQSLLVQDAFNDIIKEYERSSLEKDFLLKNFIFILLLRIREIYGPVGFFQRETLSQTAKLAYRFKHLVENKIKETREVKQYADLLNISPGHLSDTVKKIFGKSPREIINSILLLEAKVLLRSTDQSISEIARLLRFDDQSHFNHFIKHHTGYSPRELRKKL